MPISLIIDTAGGANFGGYDLRNVGRLHVGGSGLPTTGYVLQATGAALVTGNLRVEGASTFIGTITGSLTGNASSATVLANTRTIWGQNFNGSANVSGAFSGATTGAFSSNVTVGGTLGVTGNTTINGNLTVVGTVNFGASGTTYTDNQKLNFGTGNDYWFVYNSAGTALELWTTNYNGAGADGIVWNVQDGGRTFAVVGAVTVGGAATFSGNILVTSTSTPVITVDRTAGNYGILRFSTGSNSRWDIRVNSDAETGSDAGTNFEIVARTDAGSLIDSPVSIIRADGGAITLDRPLTVTGAATLGNIVMSGDLYRTTDTAQLRLAGGGSGSGGARLLLYGGTHATLANIADWYAGTTHLMRLNASGNLGIGTTDIEAWASGRTAIELGADGFLMHATGNMHVGRNAYYDSGGWKYKGTDEASVYYQSAGQHVVLVAPSGTADTAITWTTALTIDNDGDATFGGTVTASSFTGSLAATNLTGTIASARLSGSYTGITGLGTLSSLTVSGLLTAGSLNLGGATVTDILSVTTVWDPGSIPNGGAPATTTVTVTGAAVGDAVFVPSGILAGTSRVILGAYVSAANTVTLLAWNVGSASIDPSSTTIPITVFKF